MCIIGTPRPSAAVVADLATWATKLDAGVLAVDLEGDLSALLVEMAASDRGPNVRLLTPSSPVGIPIAFKPMSALSSASGSEEWKRLRGWLPQLLATLAGASPGSPDHDGIATWFLDHLDRTKAESPSILTIQGLVAAIKSAIAGGGSPFGAEVGGALSAELDALAEDLRNAALSYGAPVDLRRLLDTPLDDQGTSRGATTGRHVDVVNLSHMAQVADRNAIITAILLEVFAWCRLSGRHERLLLVLPEVASPASFIQTRPFSQRLAKRVLAASKGTGLLAVVQPSSLEDPPGMPRFGALIIERAAFVEQTPGVEATLREQGMSPEAWGRMGMLATNEWALAAGAGWSKWHRFSPSDASIRQRKLDQDALARILTTDVRDAFSHKPEAEEEGEEGEEGPSEEERQVAEAARALEDSEDLLAFSTERRSAKADRRRHQEVQELLRRKLEEKERAKEAQRFELSEIDLVEGEEAEEADLQAPPSTPRPLSGGVIDDLSGSASGPAATTGIDLHSEDLKLELAAIEAREAEEARRAAAMASGTEVVVDLGTEEEGWEGISPEVALGAAEEAEDQRRPEKGEDDGDEDEDLIIEVNGD